MKLRVVAVAAMLTGVVAHTANAQLTIFPQLVGVWNHLESGHSIDVRPTGDVWTTGGSLARTASTIQSGANFAFEGVSVDGRGWRCAYYITFLRGNHSANWRLVATRGPIDCPRGVFQRVSRYQG
jgi:hypothetical protein